MVNGGTHHPRLRHWLMQLSLWLVLAAMLGMAELVRWHHLRVRQVELSPAAVAGQLVVPMPIGWAQQGRVDGVEFVEPGPAGQRRRIEVRRTQTLGFSSPLEFLTRTGELTVEEAAAIERPGRDGTGTSGFRNVPVAGWPGLMLSQTRLLPLAGARQPFQLKQVVACTILPTRDVLLVRLEGQGVVESGDEQLVQRMAAALKVREPRPARVGGAVRVGEGISLDVPPQLATVPVQDRFRTSRTFLATGRAGWLGVDLTRCVVLDDEPATALQLMLVQRDPAYRPAEVEQIDEQVFRCERGPSALFPGVAYLMVDAGGEALLAEFRWDGAGGGPAERAEAQELWEKIKESVMFPEKCELPQWVQRGKETVGRLPHDPAELLKVEGLGKHRWQWYDEDLPRTWEMLVQYSLRPDFVEGVQRRADPSSDTGGPQEWWWRMTRDGGTYDYECGQNRGKWVVIQKSHLAGGKLEIQDVRSGLRTDSDALTAFVPGGLFPLALGSLSFEPLAVRTDSLAAVVWGPAPLTLLMRPETAWRRRLADEKSPMRCWDIEVNGTGYRSLWYLDSSGRVVTAEFAGKLHMQRIESPATLPSATQEGDDQNGGR